MTQDGCSPEGLERSDYGELSAGGNALEICMHSGALQSVSQNLLQFKRLGNDETTQMIDDF